MGNIFGGIEKTQMDNGTGTGRPFLVDGDYVIEVEAFKTKLSENKESKNYGEGMAIIEGTVLEVTREVPGVSLRPGQQFVNIQVLERDKKDELTANGARAMGRVKAFVAAAIQAQEADITAAACADLASGDGTTLAGLRLQVSASPSISRKTGKTFTNLSWSSLG